MRTDPCTMSASDSPLYLCRHEWGVGSEKKKKRQRMKESEGKEQALSVWKFTRPECHADSYRIVSRA